MIHRVSIKHKRHRDSSMKIRRKYTNIFIHSYKKMRLKITNFICKFASIFDMFMYTYTDIQNRKFKRVRRLSTNFNRLREASQRR